MIHYKNKKKKKKKKKETIKQTNQKKQRNSEIEPITGDLDPTNRSIWKKDLGYFSPSQVLLVV